jgi:hypothetical protein
MEFNMKKINSKSELPKWFDIKNYTPFKSMDEHLLNIEIYFRRTLCVFKRLQNHPQLFDLNHLRNQPIYKLIISSQPVFHNPDNDNDDDYFDILKSLLQPDTKRLASLSLEDIKRPDSKIALPIKPLSVDNVVHLATELERIGKIKDSDFSLNKATSAAFDVPGISALLHKNGINHMKDGLYGKVQLWVNINYYTDDEIISALASSLPEWRKSLNIEQPTRYAPRADDQKKMAKYEIFALHDLLLWGFVENVKIKKSVLGLALYPDGNLGESELKSTIIPFMNRVFSMNYKKG